MAPSFPPHPHPEAANPSIRLSAEAGRVGQAQDGLWRSPLASKALAAFDSCLARLRPGQGWEPEVQEEMGLGGLWGSRPGCTSPGSPPVGAMASRQRPVKCAGLEPWPACLWALAWPNR